MQITQQEIDELKRKGFGDGEIQRALKELEEEELQKSYFESQNTLVNDPRQYSQISPFSSKQDDNLVKWQLELNDILERAEHILKGDVPKFKDGHIIWEKNPHPENNPLNELGVQEVMKILSMYVNRNTILADYTNEEINIKVYDFGRALNNLIFMKDYEFGMDTPEKRKNYEMLVTELKDIVHSAYKRALEGAEKRSLREMIQITQQTSTQFQDSNQLQKERSIFNPMRYIRGKYA